MAQENGKLLAWRKKEGERVIKGEPLLEIETDKAVVEVEAPGDGILAGVTADVGAVVPVGQIIAWLVAPGEKPPAMAVTAAPAARASSSPQRTSAAAAVQATEQRVALATQISPKARRLAKELGVDISKIRGTGHEGTITSEDVQSLAQGEGAAAPPGMELLSQVGRLMAERTTQSWTSVPHFFLVRDVDCGELVAAQTRFRQAMEKTHDAAPTITDVLISLLAKVLVKHTRMNSSWTGEGIRSNPEINVSVAMAVNDGVVGAVIHKANTAKLAQISTLRRELTDRARAGRLRPADITGGGLSPGKLGLVKDDGFSADITPPPAAALPAGRSFRPGGAPDG